VAGWGVMNTGRGMLASRRRRGRSDAAAARERCVVDDVLEPLPPLWPDSDLAPPADERTARRRVPSIVAILAIFAVLVGVVIVGVGAIPRGMTPGERRACFVAGARAGYSGGYTNGYTAGLDLRSVLPALRRWMNNADTKDSYANVSHPAEAFFGAPRC
jgi:hypothetical protein